MSEVCQPDPVVECDDTAACAVVEPERIIECLRERYVHALMRRDGKILRQRAAKGNLLADDDLDPKLIGLARESALRKPPSPCNRYVRA
jgi:hypothetical protein